MPARKKEPAFEEALEKLEALVQSMESGEVALSDLVARFEEGTRLLHHCEKALKDAELKIEQLRKDGAALELEPFNDDSAGDNEP